MKKVLIILVALIGFGISAFAQDIITLKNGTDINALVQEIDDAVIKYKKFDNPTGPNYTLKKSEILIIRYANGSKDIFSETEKYVEQPSEREKSSTAEQNNENVETVYLENNTPQKLKSFEEVMLMSENEARLYLNTYARSDIYDTYYRGKRLSKNGGILISIGVGCAVGGFVGLLMPATNGDNTMSIVCFAVAAPFTIIGIPIFAVGKNKKKSSANDYNDYKYRYNNQYSSYQPTLNFNYTINGFGISLNF